MEGKEYTFTFASLLNKWKCSIYNISHWTPQKSVHKKLAFCH